MKIRVNIFLQKVLFFVISAMFFLTLSVGSAGKVHAYEKSINDSLNDAYSKQAAKIMYTHCKTALSENVNAEDFQATACYAHVIGAVGMLGILLHIEAYVAKEDVPRAPYEKAIAEATCTVKGKTIRDIASSYVKAIEYYNREASDEDGKEYATLPHLLLNKQLCEPFFGIH
jgi:hypothetical protein